MSEQRPANITTEADLLRTFVEAGKGWPNAVTWRRMGLFADGLR